MLITSTFNHVLPVVVSLIAVPIIAIYLTRIPKYKIIGTGMLIGLIPLSILVVTIITLSRLH
ncbi:hypothetical protein [Kordia antarctica]|uniref:hypothetical protein n=1 Tax=Kordia antarctica TaxID=1218801 RepID=UPI0013584F37|nr:hypothetical protein [Kordia antarctica]